MNRRVGAIATFILILLVPAPALGGEEPEPPAPSIGEPVITIPIDTDDIAQLIVTDVALSPTSGLAPGDTVRLIARLAAGSAPARTVMVIDGIGEIAGDVPVAADGSVDHEFILPDDLPAGTYRISLAALELGITAVGVIEVTQPTDTTSPTTAAESQPAAPGTTAPAEQAIAEPQRGRSGSSLPLGIATLAFLILALLVIFLIRRRKRAVARFEGSASLPTATHTVLAAPHEKDADLAEPVRAAGSISKPKDSEPEDLGSAQRDDTAPMPDGNEVLVIELRATTGADGEAPPSELVLGSFGDVERAKEAARQARQDSGTERSEEVWWEVRSPGKGPVWMIHAWAPREYNINSETGEATAASH